MSCKITITCGCCKPDFKVTGGDGVPTADPGVTYALYTDFVTGTLYAWNKTLGQWI